MRVLTSIGMAAAAAFAGADWIAVARRNKPMEYFFKPAVMVALMVAASSLEPFSDARRGWFVVALALSAAGDVFLMLPRDAFVQGLGAFLLAHVAYIAGFHFEGPSLAAWLGVSAVVGLASAVIARRIIEGLLARSKRALVAPVVAYMVVITLMVGKAIADGRPASLAGALLFYTSDALIGWTRFVEERPRAPLAIIVTYHLGQAGLVLSLL